MNKTAPVLLLSLATNLALAVLVYSLHAPGQRTEPAATEATRNVRAAASVIVPQTPAASGANPVDVSYVARLRTAGMPADLIRDLVYLRVRARYRDRQRALLPDTADEYWRSWNQTGSQTASSETRAKLRELDKEMQAEVQALLGDGPEALDPHQRQLYDQMAATFSNTKIQQIEAIRKDYDEMAARVRERAKGLVLKSDREQLRLLEAERRRDLAAVLSPEELLEYDLRVSPTANNVRNRLAFFEPTEEEYRALTKLQLELDRQYGLNNLSGAEQDRRKAAEKDLIPKIQSVLSPDRFDDYRVTIDGMYSETRAFASAYNLDASAAKAIVALKQSTWKRIDELDQAGVTGDQRTSTLKTLEQEVENTLTTRLGADIFANYKRTGATWMNRLRSNPPKS
jgi:uncharacterized protein (DUF4415 family)